MRSYANGDELLYSIDREKNHIDLLFLDVEMPGKSGLEIKQILSKDVHVGSIVFVTSHIGIMQEAFGLKVIGFIEKPVDSRTISQWIKNVYDNISKVDFIDIKKNVTVRTIDIKYITVDGIYSKIIMEDGTESELMRESISKWEKRLDSSFVRCHKSFIVNMIYISSLKYSIIILDNEEVLPVGRKYYQDLKEIYNNFLLEGIKGRLGWHN